MSGLKPAKPSLAGSRDSRQEAPLRCLADQSLARCAWTRYSPARKCAARIHGSLPYSEGARHSIRMSGS